MSLDRTHSIEKHHDFTSPATDFQRHRASFSQPGSSEWDTDFSELWLGLAIFKMSEHEVALGFSVNDGTYSIDFAVHHLCLREAYNADQHSHTFENHIISSIAHYRSEHRCKILGAGVTIELNSASPRLCSRLWAELDIVPIVFHNDSSQGHYPDVDELADSVARKCLSAYGPTKQPRIVIDFHNEVQVDLDGQIRLTDTEAYHHSVRAPTWRTVQKHIKAVKDRNARIVFFSATPQGGGVALMRHALLRFLRREGVQIEWFVPKPRPDVFRITKTNHNILQGAVGPEVRTTDEQLEKIKCWIIDNAQRYWLKHNGPLKGASEGGADVIIIDDPQMPELIPIAKKEDPNRPVIFRSHIEVRDDLVQENGSAAQHVLNFMWASIKHADVFISHPVKNFVPPDVRPETVGWLPATTDWLDGLNKYMSDWDNGYYLKQFRQACVMNGSPQLEYPKRPYITQVARFDPSKGIPDVIKSYAKFRKMFQGDAPQLVICGHSSIDDPDGSLIFDQTMCMIHDDHSQYKDDIVVARLGPSDQLLNAIMSMSKVALQLSTREGFEVKVSEALHKGKPVIATNTGGIPLQIEHGRSGYLVERGDHQGVAKHLYDLFTDHKLYGEMSSYAKSHVSDEVHTVGNAVSWMYMASAVLDGKWLPKERWINDLARETADEPYGNDEPQLPRHLSTS